MSTATARRGDWMLTYTGRQFWPLDARPDDISPVDIAHALSQLCRYGGHTSRFYSVAEHCVLMSEAVPPEHALWALLHDATEAYMVDLPRPIKRQFPDYSRAEDALMVHIAARFGIPVTPPPCVKDADNRILIDERAALMNPSGPTWSALEGLEPLGVQVVGWPPFEAEARYLRRLAELAELTSWRS